MILNSVASQMQTTVWQWQDWQGLPYLTCNLLDNWQHGFFTQQFSPRLPEELIETLQPSTKVYRVKQVHGNRVVVPGEMNTKVSCENGENILTEADGIVTEEEQQSVWVASADCNPILVGDVNTGRVAAIHAGWRGTALQILPQTIDRLIALGSSLENLSIAIGPAIAGEVYQVTQQVAAEVGQSLIDTEIDTPEAILDALRQMPNSPILEDSQPGRARLDVRRVNYLQLERLGINPEQISIAPYCTYQQPEYFFSYRRTKLKKVQWSGIISKNF